MLFGGSCVSPKAIWLCIPFFSHASESFSFAAFVTFPLNFQSDGMFVLVILISSIMYIFFKAHVVTHFVSLCQFFLFDCNLMSCWFLFQ